MPSGTMKTSLAERELPGTLSLIGGSTVPTLYSQRSRVTTYLTGRP